MRFASLQIKAAKWLDEYLGRVLIALVRALRGGNRATQSPGPALRILVIKFWGMGSIILLEPALRLLRECHPHAKIDFLTLAQNRELFAFLPCVEHVHTLDLARPLRFMGGVCKISAHLRRQQYDIILDAEFFANFSALLARFAAPKKLLGFSRSHGCKRNLLDVAVPFHDHEHAVQNFLRLASAAVASPPRNAANRGSPWDAPRIIVNATRRDRCFEHVVVMNVNASPLALERRWPQENFVQLAQWLLRRHAIKLMLIGNREEKAYTQQVADRIASPERAQNFAGALSLRELAEVIHSCALFISNDSGPLHLAAALHKPVVGFYGPETPQRFGPLCERRLIFYLGLECSPCMSVDNAKTVNCTNHLRCMRELRVQQVVRVLERFISQHELLPLLEMKNAETLPSPAGALPYAV